MSELLLSAVFWVSVAAVAWTYLLFPLVLALRALRPTPRPRTDGQHPSVSYVIVVHNEASVIDRKLANLERLGYPRGRLEVIIASDGSDDGTDERIAAHAGPTPVRLLSLPRVGKNAALNAGALAASGSVLVFSDADSMLEPDALERLVAPFADTTVGGVAGDYRYDRGDDQAGGERAYWSFDRLWKRFESRAGSVTSATGQLYAIRRSLFTPVPDGVTDDFYVSTGVIAAGLRLWFEEEAVARGPAAETVDAEYARKVRLIGRGFSSVWQRVHLLDARTTGFYALQLLSHKVLRRLIGIPLIAAAVTAPLLWSLHPVYRVATLAQLVLHGLALAGWLTRRHRIGRSPLFALPLFVDVANLAGLHAFIDFLRGRQRLGWEPQRPAPVPELGTRAAPAERGS